MDDIKQLLHDNHCTDTELMKISNRVIETVKHENTLPAMLSLAAVLRAQNAKLTREIEYITIALIVMAILILWSFMI